MKGMICRTEWPICLRLSLPGIPQGLSHGAGRGEQAADVGQADRQPWQLLAVHRLGAARGWQEVCDGVASDVLWLDEILHFPAGMNLHKELEESPRVCRGAASRALHLAVPSQSGASSCFSTWILPLC